MTCFQARLQTLTPPSWYRMVKAGFVGPAIFDISRSSLKHYLAWPTELVQRCLIFLSSLPQYNFSDSYQIPQGLARLTVAVWLRAILQFAAIAIFRGIFGYIFPIFIKKPSSTRLCRLDKSLNSEFFQLQFLAGLDNNVARYIAGKFQTVPKFSLDTLRFIAKLTTMTAARCIFNSIAGSLFK